MRESKLKPESTRQAFRRSMVGCLAGTLLLLLAMVVAPTPSSARVSVGIFVSFGPPALPVYAQPPCPAPGYIWTPGYWAWDPAYGYYWVPGTWVPAPFMGALWTPGYWGYDDDDDGYRWHPGYWGYAVGYYGGINYGFGYNGYGYHGGYWNHDHFYYNRSVSHIVTRNITHVYYRRVNDHFDGGRRVSYNGGPGGLHVRPTRQQMAVERSRHFGPVHQQLRQERFARTHRSQWARENHGRPGVAATRRPGAFSGRDAVRAERAGAPYHGPQREFHGREFSRSAHADRGNNNGFRSFGSSGNEQPYRRRENRAPVERVNRQPAYRNGHQGSFERPQRQQHRPQEMRRVESRPAPQQWHGNSARQEERGGGNGHGGGNHGRENGNGHGRGGRH